MDGKTILARAPEDFTRRLDELDIEVIGLNCAWGQTISSMRSKKYVAHG